MTDPTRTLHGACLCGHVAYTVPDAFEYALICHCSQCRRATGAAAKPFAGIAAERLSVAAPERLLIHGDATTHDAHCSRCGSLLWSQVRDGAYVHVTLGTLTEAPTIRPSAHIFVGSKAEWDAICDDLPQFEVLPE